MDFRQSFPWHHFNQSPDQKTNAWLHSKSRASLKLTPPRRDLSQVNPGYISRKWLENHAFLRFKTIHMWGEKERFHQSHRPHHYPNSGVVENGSFCISWPIQSCNQVTQGSTHSRSLSPLLSRQLPGVGGRSLNSAPPAPHEYADKCVTSVPERLELYGEAHPKPPTLRRRAPKNIKNPSLCWGESFWTESGSLKSIIPAPPLRALRNCSLSGKWKRRSNTVCIIFLRLQGRFAMKWESYFVTKLEPSVWLKFDPDRQLHGLEARVNTGDVCWGGSPKRSVDAQSVDGSCKPIMYGWF